MRDKTIITAAITGAVHIPSMSDYLPITPNQIIEDAVAAANAGAAVVHIHARDEKNGKPTSDSSIMEKIYNAIKEQTDAIICVTTGGAIGLMTVEERLAAIPLLRPELASLNAGTINFTYSDIANKINEPKYDWEIPYVKNTYKMTFPNTFQSMQEYIEVMEKHWTKPEFEVYDVGMINNLAYLKNKGILDGPVYLQFVLGILGGIPATIDNLQFLYKTAVDQLGSENFVWSVAIAGKSQFDLTTAAMLLGGNVRVGLEDNLYLKKGVLAKSNKESVEKMRNIIEIHDREIASPDEARKILGLS